MKYEVVVARTAQVAYERLDARWRSIVKTALVKHLTHEPKKESKSRIKRLRGFRRPQYRLRVHDIRIFYDVNDGLRRVEVLGLIRKPNVERWLEEQGVTT